MTKLLFQVNAMQCHESNCEMKCNIEVCENRMNLRCKPKITCYFKPVSANKIATRNIALKKFSDTIFAREGNSP